MDVEWEELAKVLLSDGIPETWKDTEECSTYMTQLASCGIERLGKEGAHLRDERVAILDQTRELAYTNYKTFIHTAECSRTIFKDFTKVEGHLGKLSGSLPGLRGSVEEFLAKSRSLAQSRHLTSLTLTKHTQLLEILELPQLMDTCVRNGYYDEALEILSYVRRLEKKHSDIPIIASIVSEVQAGTKLMLSQLLAQLRTPLALPQCLRVIGFLRRLDVFSEPELRLKFLQARDSWFNNLIKTVPKEDPHHHIIKVVEVSRVHLFDIVTQYRAIFSDDDARHIIGDPDVNEQAIFHGWILHKVNQFIEIVEKDLKKGVGNNLESVLAQCMFFGQSFSRIGADFRSLLSPMFQKAAFIQFEKDVRSANIKFDETLSSFSLMEPPQLSASGIVMGETQDKTRPHPALMEFPPLAHYANGLIASFNILRLCCPVAIVPDVVKLLDQSLSKVITALVEMHRHESSGFTSREEETFGRLCIVVHTALIPHINICLRLLFPLHQLAVISGVPVMNLQKENYGLLNVASIIAPMEHLIPKKEKEEIPELDLDSVGNLHMSEEPLNTAVQSVPVEAKVESPEIHSSVSDGSLDGEKHSKFTVGSDDLGHEGQNQSQIIISEETIAHLEEKQLSHEAEAKLGERVVETPSEGTLQGAANEPSQIVSVDLEEPVTEPSPAVCLEELVSESTPTVSVQEPAPGPTVNLQESITEPSQTVTWIESGTEHNQTVNLLESPTEQPNQTVNILESVTEDSSQAVNLLGSVTEPSPAVNLLLCTNEPSHTGNLTESVTNLSQTVSMVEPVIESSHTVNSQDSVHEPSTETIHTVNLLDPVEEPNPTLNLLVSGTEPNQTVTLLDSVTALNQTLSSLESVTRPSEMVNLLDSANEPSQLAEMVSEMKLQPVGEKDAESEGIQPS